VWLGLDRTTENAPLPVDWKERANTIKKLIDAGWGHRIRARPQQHSLFTVFGWWRNSKRAAAVFRGGV